MSSESELTRALCLYVGYGTYPYPGSHWEDVAEKMGTHEADKLRSQVMALMAFANNIVFEQSSLSEIAEHAKREIRNRYPNLEERAVSALVWDITFSLK